MKQVIQPDVDGILIYLFLMIVSYIIFGIIQKRCHNSRIQKRIIGSSVVLGIIALGLLDMHFYFNDCTLWCITILAIGAGVYVITIMVILEDYYDNAGLRILLYLVGKLLGIILIAGVHFSCVKREVAMIGFILYLLISLLCAWVLIEKACLVDE